MRLFQKVHATMGLFIYKDLRACYFIVKQKLSYVKKQLHYGGWSSAI